MVANPLPGQGPLDALDPNKVVPPLGGGGWIPQGGKLQRMHGEAGFIAGCILAM